MINKKNELVRVELHLHTCYSKDSLMTPEKVIRRCDVVGIDKVAITDHNMTDGAFLLKARYPDRVIVGEEIETSDGELIGYFLSEWVPQGLEPIETVQRLRAQGAVITIPHPFDHDRGLQWSEQGLMSVAPYVDAIETFNARCLSDIPNQKALSFARERGLLETVGSDAHSVGEVGKANLLMTGFSNAEEFKLSLKSAEKLTDLSSPLVHLFTRYAVRFKRMKKRYHLGKVC